MPTHRPSIAPKHGTYDNACFEQIAFTGLSQKQDSSPDNLIPTF
jgi:hypothetical protein